MMCCNTEAGDVKPQGDECITCDHIVLVPRERRGLAVRNWKYTHGDPERYAPVQRGVNARPVR